MYALRHGGASFDIVSNSRELLEVKTRGRWQSDQSLRRYQKPSKAQAELNKLGKDTVKFGQAVLDNLEALFDHPELMVRLMPLLADRKAP